MPFPLSSTWWAKLTVALALCVFCNTVETSSVPFPGENLCPVSCKISRSKPDNWTTYSSVDRLKFCHDTMLLDFAVYTPLGDPQKHTTIRACTPSKPDSKRDNERRTWLSGRGAANQTTAAVQVAWWNSSQSAETSPCCRWGK
jgi:chitinase